MFDIAGWTYSWTTIIEGKDLVDVVLGVGEYDPGIGLSPRPYNYYLGLSSSLSSSSNTPTVLTPT